MARLSTLPAALLLLTSAAAQTDAVFHWPLDETSGNTVHDIVSGAHGILMNGASLAPDEGRHGGAVRFDGAIDRIDLPPCDITSGGQGFSISLWVKPDMVTGTERVLLAKASGTATHQHLWSLSIVDGSAVRFRLRAGNSTAELTTPPSSLFSGTWYHLAGSYDGSSMRIHVNGALIAFGQKSGMVGFNPEMPASMGARTDGSGPFSGWIDQVRIYDRSLSDSEVIGQVLEDVTTGIGPEVPWYWDGEAIVVGASGWQRMRLHDAGGRLVMEQRVTSDRDMLRSAALTRGVYLLVLQDGPRSHSQRVVVP